MGTFEAEDLKQQKIVCKNHAKLLLIGKLISNATDLKSSKSERH